MRLKHTHQRLVRLLPGIDRDEMTLSATSGCGVFKCRGNDVSALALGLGFGGMVGTSKCLPLIQTLMELVVSIAFVDSEATSGETFPLVLAGVAKQSSEVEALFDLEEVLVDGSLVELHPNPLGHSIP